MQKIINKKDLFNQLSELLKDFEIIGPKELTNKGIFYQPITVLSELYLGNGFTIEPAKKFFLEPSSCLLGYQQTNEVLVEDIPQSEKKRIVLGVRPCEARGLTLLDKVFDSDYKDNFYIHNRKRTIIVGLACSSPDRSCFCTSMGGSPVESPGMDALLFDIEGRFIVEVITDKGEDIFSAIGEELKDDEKKFSAEKDNASRRFRQDF